MGNSAKLPLIAPLYGFAIMNYFSPFNFLIILAAFSLVGSNNNDF